MRSISFSGVAVPTVMIVLPPQIAVLDVRGRDDPAVERDRSGLLNVRRREVAPDLAAPVAQAERDADLVALADVRRDAPRLDLAPVEELPDRALLEERADVLVLGQLLAHRVDELELAGRADQVAHLLLVADAGHLDHDSPRPVAGRLGSDLRLADADAGDAALDRVARRAPPARSVIGSSPCGCTSSVTRRPPWRSRPSTVRNWTPPTSSGSQPRPSVVRGRSMKIARRAITPMSHGAMRRQVMVWPYGSSIVW